jgi:hypothetical protein
MNALRGREILKLSGIKPRFLPAGSLTSISAELPRFFCVVGDIQYMLRSGTQFSAILLTNSTHYVYFLYYLCIAVLTLDAGLLARNQYPEGPATGHLDTGFSLFPCVYKRMLRWFPSFQVATTCLSCSPPDFNSLVTLFYIFVYM